MSRIGRVVLLTAFLMVCGAALAQDSPHTLATAPPSATSQNQPAHGFWDTENILLFAGVGGARMLDYASTRHLRNQGNNEWLLTNSIVDNRPLFVGIELAGTAASIGVSYLFHRTGHHSLERWTSFVHIDVAVFGSIRNYLLTPPARQPTQASIVPAAPSF
jgi:hypothetical protein